VKLYSTTFILLISLCSINKSYSQTDTTKLIDINCEKCTIRDLNKQIESQTRFHIYYDSAIFVQKSFTYTAKAEPLNKVLHKLFAGELIYASFDDQNNIFFSKNRALSLMLPDSYFNGTNNAIAVNDTNIEDEDLLDSKEALVDKKIYEIGDKNNKSQKSIVIGGIIKDAKTGQPVSGANVYIENPRIGATTDQFGAYTISLPRGKHILNIQSIGLRDIKRQIVLYSDGKMNVDMTESIQSLKRVTVSSKKLSNIRGSQMGVQKIDIKTIKQIPMLFGEADIIRAITTLPGVKTVGEASTGFNVRGGSSDQNLILFNDATVYNPSHFFGLFSAFNPEVVNSVELYKSSIPASYGGRLSSVLDINSREGNKKEFTGSAGIGPLTSRLNVEGPLVKDKSSFILGGRTTYSNWLFKYLPDDYKNSAANFYDINLITTHELDKNNSLYFTAYISNDKFNLNSDTAYSYGNRNVSLKWKHTYNAKLNSVMSAGLDQYNYEIGSQKLPLNAYKLAFNIQQTNFKAHFNYFYNNKHSFDFGINSILYKLNPGNFDPNGSQSLVKPDHLQTEQGLESAVYFSDHFTVTPKFKIDAGLRLSMFNVMGPNDINVYADGVPRSESSVINTVHYDNGKIIKTYGGPEVRLGFRYVFDETFSLKGGFNTQRQYIHSLSNTTAMAPTDIWKLSDPNIKPQIGNQFSLGLYKNLRSNTIETSVEVYYKNIKNYLDYKSGAVLVMNHHIETDVIGTKGKAYGVELLVKKVTGKLNGWVSYTWSRILLQQNDPNAGELINNGNPYAANYDKPNDVTVVTNYKFSHRVSISLNANYSTGRPITLPIGLFDYGGSMRTLYADRNAYRIPDYFRTDFSMNIEGNHKVKQLFHNSWSIGVYNLTGRKNPYSVYYVSENGHVNGYKLSIFGNAIPYINLNIRFK
jgi:CarboxypepD_reg-like domain/TonB-dependent Receptor Plug Domain